MADLGGYDATQVKDSEYEVIPSGDYRVLMTESEKVETKDRKSHLLKCKFQILDGPMKNRTFFDRFNLWNASEKATLIAQQQFKKVCEAINVLKPADSSDLHGKPLMCRLAVKDYNGKDQNEVKGYKSALTQQAKTEEKAKTAGKPAGW